MSKQESWKIQYLYINTQLPPACGIAWPTGFKELGVKTDVIVFEDIVTVILSEVPTRKRQMSANNLFYLVTKIKSIKYN
jgi:hypothetical protein